MAITLQRFNRSPSCLVLWWGFQGHWIEWCRFRHSVFLCAHNVAWFKMVFMDVQMKDLMNYFD